MCIGVYTVAIVCQYVYVAMPPCFCASVYMSVVSEHIKRVGSISIVVRVCRVFVYIGVCLCTCVSVCVCVFVGVYLLLCACVFVCVGVSVYIY